MNDDATQDPVNTGDDDNSGDGGNLPESDIPLENTVPDAPPNNEDPDGM